MTAQHEGEPQDQHGAARGSQQEASMPSHPQQAVKAEQKEQDRHQDVDSSQVKDEILIFPSHIDAEQEKEQEIRDDAPRVPDQQRCSCHESQQRDAEGKQCRYDGNHKQSIEKPELSIRIDTDDHLPERADVIWLIRETRQQHLKRRIAKTDKNIRHEQAQDALAHQVERFLRPRQHLLARHHEARQEKEQRHMEGIDHVMQPTVRWHRNPGRACRIGDTMPNDYQKDADALRDINIR